MEVSPAKLDPQRWAYGALALVLAFACLRFAHLHLLWADEDYHIAAALNILHGKVPYRDFWYDKPPLSALYYLLIGGHGGWLLRALDASYVITACGISYRLAKLWWGKTEALIAACALSFFLAFYLPSAVIPFAADAVMLVPHLLAMYSAAAGRYLWAGVWAGVAFLANIKGALVLAAVAVWAFPQLALPALGFTIPVAVGAALLYLLGAWPAYVEQVWRWGLLYASGSPVLHPWSNGLLRTANWAGFHAALIVAGFLGFRRLGKASRWKLGTWMVLSYAGVALGSRFAPHYFLQLLPPAVLLASFGIARMIEARNRLCIALLTVPLLVPLIRFGPRYVALVYDDVRGVEPRWSDVAMDLDSQDVAKRIEDRASRGDTLFVWGYRPDIYVYTRMVSDSRFWDSQPVTGVAADRHLYATTAIYGGPAAANRLELSRSHSTWLVDGLGLLNPRLAPDQYPELRDWLGQYRLVGRTKLSLIYHRKD